VVTDRIALLIGLLDDESTEIAEDAKAELMAIGGEALPALIAAVGSLEPFGQLSTIEIFEEVGDPAAGGALIGLLESPADTVREWSAGALASLGVVEAVPALRDAYRRQRASGDGLDLTEAVALRRALTTLGARRDVRPPLTASLMVRDSCPSARLVDVINDLADHDQAVLYFMLWEVRDGGMYWHGHETLDQDLDLSTPWPAVVEAAREAALIEAALVVPTADLVAGIEWVDQADLLTF
jgi:HEAT repeat protein